MKTTRAVQISDKRAGAVRVPIDAWRAIRETLHLLSIRGMRTSIRKGLKTPIRECVQSLDW
jgi:PHD/YefM family antitoxin component YafN of YafNO toxin-antitoxin module